jgi:chemotaxis protein methyltransferase CheR
MRITDFDLYRDLLKERSGLVLGQDKSYLLDSRLSPIARKWGYPTLDAMTNALRGVPDKDLVNDIIEAMTTNETSFFRDNKPFEMFKEVVLKYMKENRASRKELRIWCAAASSGQEPYSIAMILKEAAAQFPGWRFTIKATDISDQILNQAREGVYSQFEVQRGLPIQFLMKYFTQDEEKWRISNDIKAMVNYGNFNLLDNMAALGRFDVIFCRNVLIYFDEKTKASILERMGKQLESDGILFLGGAETVLGITEAFKPFPAQRGLYAQPGSVHFTQGSASGAGSTQQALA